MKGFYVYCIRPHTTDAKTRKAKKEGFQGSIRTIVFRDIEAVVSEVDISKFNEKTVGDKLREDVAWTKKNVTHHHEVVSRAYKIGAVIPMKFGTIFKTRQSLEAMLGGHYEKFRKLLSQLRDKQEWGVKMYLAYQKFAEILKKKNKEVSGLEKKRPSMSEGMRWYVDRKIEERIAGQYEEETEKQLQLLVRKLEECSEKILLNDPLPKEVSEPGKDMILNAACLVRNDALGEFKKMIKETALQCDTAGITLMLTGPWPPYNFVEIKNNGGKKPTTK